jgi:predicted dehydrogenase
MKFLIAGLGSIGRRHLRNLLALGERDVLLYRTDHSTLPDDELEGLPVENDLQAALAHKPQAVIIANPTALHLDVAIPAAQAGSHLLLEKPVSASGDPRVQELVNAVEKSGSRVLVGFQFRFHPGLQQIDSLLKAGRIGRPLTVRAHWGEYLPGWHPWEDYRQGYSARSALGGGVLLTLCHPLDYLRWLFGDISALWAFTGKLGDLELDVEDTAEIGLQFQSGTLGSVHLDYNQRLPAHRLEIIGTRGTIHWDNADGAVQLYQAEPAGENAPTWETFVMPEGFTRNDLFLAEMRHFVSVARGEADPACTLEDGLRALEIVAAAHQSSQTGCKISMRIDKLW